MGLTLCNERLPDTVGQRNKFRIDESKEEEHKSSPPARFPGKPQKYRSTSPKTENYFAELVERRCGSVMVDPTKGAIYPKLLLKRAKQVESVGRKSTMVTHKASIMVGLAREIARANAS